MPDQDIAAIITAVDRVSLKLDTATSAALTANARADGLTVTNVGLASRIVTLEGVNATQAATIVYLTAEVARLQAIIDGEEPPDPPPDPPSTDTDLGATINTKSGQTYAQAVADWETKRDRIAVLRTFNSGGPATWTACANATQMAGRHRIISVKTSGTAAYWDRLIASIPHDTTPDGDPCITMLVDWHEPENDGGTMTPTKYRVDVDLMEQRITASGRADVIPGTVLMTWLERDDDPATTSKSWFPTRPERFVLLVDPYDPNGNKTLQEQTLPTLLLWRQAGGTFWGIAETGSHRTGSTLAQWITAGVGWAHDEGASYICWFHSAVGAQAGPTGWWLDDPAGIAAWKALAPVVRAA